MEQILDTVRAFDGVLELAPTEGSGYPEPAWGDHFFFYAPDGEVPQRVQPYATVVTKDSPGDTLSDLDPPDRRRLNIHVGRTTVTALTGHAPGGRTPPARDFRTTDTLHPHPVYGAQGWVAVVNPGPRTTPTVLALLREAHENARRRATRRSAPGAG
ncbi:DUF6194 family protein [Streptomyces sp. DSM 42041]|uniref:DUF6194 family protein n=1 Tax=Streptomyces hazeniae TaxID=3075538 RepID=A0ABU2NRI5_9ACTN|nr:DUF6194 family protein [Streptomyces sp. DSM 42041]MDT0379595.1 DUF6194 family protein [Streptomyces sp. DSM 42041]